MSWSQALEIGESTNSSRIYILNVKTLYRIILIILFNTFIHTTPTNKQKCTYTGFILY